MWDYFSKEGLSGYQSTIEEAVSGILILFLNSNDIGISHLLPSRKPPLTLQVPNVSRNFFKSAKFIRSVAISKYPDFHYFHCSPGVPLKAKKDCENRRFSDLSL